MVTQTQLQPHCILTGSFSEFWFVFCVKERSQLSWGNFYIFRPFSLTFIDFDYFSVNFDLVLVLGFSPVIPLENRFKSVYFSGKQRRKQYSIDVSQFNWEKNPLEFYHIKQIWCAPYKLLLSKKLSHNTTDSRTYFTTLSYSLAPDLGLPVVQMLISFWSKFHVPQKEVLILAQIVICFCLFVCLFVFVFLILRKFAEQVR